MNLGFRRVFCRICPHQGKVGLAPNEVTWESLTNHFFDDGLSRKSDL